MAHQQQSHRSGAFYLDQTSLLCKAGCGFFGNPEWLGYCSICFKQLNSSRQQQQQQQYQNYRPSSATDSYSSPSANALIFNPPQQLDYHQQQQQQQQQQAYDWWQQQQKHQLQQYQQQQHPSLGQQFQNMSLNQGAQYYVTPNTGNQVAHNLPPQVSQMTRSVSHMLNQTSIASHTTPRQSSLLLGNSQDGWQHQQQVPHQVPEVGPLIDLSDSAPVTPAATASYQSPFDKYGEKRRSQFTDKKSNVLKLLRRASTFKDKTETLSESPQERDLIAKAALLQNPDAATTTTATAASISTISPTSSSQNRGSNETINTSDQQINAAGNTSVASGSSSSVLNPSNLFSNLASPTSLVMSGYDTLTNLHNTIVNTAKYSFRGSPSTSNADNSSIHSASQSEYMHNTSGKRRSLQQPNFLYDVAWVDCLRHTNKFAKDLLAAEKQLDKTINNLSDLVHDFYQKMNERFENQFIYKGATPDQLELLNDNMERILSELIYPTLSARILNEDEDINIAMQRRIRSLNWITVEHLEIDIDFQHSDVHDLLDKAICQMVEMNSRTSSIDKLECIVQCSKTIFELLQVSSNSIRSIPVSADQFLPVLVFVVIQANPPMLPADIKYLNRFSNPRRLMSGETGYYFTNLCCAVEFIEKASGASLNIGEDEFNRYVNGEAVPETKSQFNTYLCDGLRTMCSNDASLKRLKRQNEARQAKIDNLLEQIDVHLETNRAKLQEMQKFAENLQERLKPSLPKFYVELLETNRDLALKLLPSHLRDTYLTEAPKILDQSKILEAG